MIKDGDSTGRETRAQRGLKLGLWFTHILNVKWPPRRACLGGAVIETRLEFQEKLATTRARLGGALIETMKWLMVGIMAPPRQALLFRNPVGTIFDAAD